MSCGTPGLSQILSRYAKEYGLSRMEVNRYFHFLKAENTKLVKQAIGDGKYSVGLTTAESWLSRHQEKITGTSTLTGPWASRWRRIQNGDSYLSLAEIDAIRRLPEILDMRSGHSQCVICFQFVGDPVHECPALGGSKEWADRLKRTWRPQGIYNTVAWWRSIPQDGQDILTYMDAEHLGNLDGIPMDVRDKANRYLLIREKSRIEALLIDADPPREDSLFSLLPPISKEELVRQLQEEMKIIEAVEKSLELKSNTRLVLFETFPLPGRAAVAIGDVDKAENVTVLVSGLNSFVPRKLVEHTRDALEVQDTANFYNEFLHADAEPGDNATIAWLGYHPPDYLSVAFRDKAEKGAPLLKNFITGIRAHRDNADDVNITLIGHSYGSVVSSLAASKKKDTDYPLVDNLAIIGSPGMTVRRASRLRAHEGQVFAAAADWDLVSYIGRFGGAPTSRRFGSFVLKTSAGVDPLTGQKLERSFWHSEYYKRGTFALRNLALLAIGRNDLIEMENQCGILKTCKQGKRPNISKKYEGRLNPAEVFDETPIHTI